MTRRPWAFLCLLSPQAPLPHSPEGRAPDGAAGDPRRVSGEPGAYPTRTTTSDVLATVDSLISEEPDQRKHPFYHLARRMLRCGTYRTSGQRAHMADHLSAVFEDLLSEATERLVGEALANFGPWED
jgi:hypothetical protein